MPKTYTTVQGDMWDSISYKVYGREYGMDTLLKANQAYRDVAIFPQGIQLICPDLPESAAAIMPPWRR